MAADNAPTTTDPPPLLAVLKALFGSVYAPSLLAAIAQHAVTIMLPLYVLRFDNGAALAALMLGARGAGIMLSDVPAGILVSRFGDKRVMLGALFSLIAITAVAAFAESALALLAVAFISGVGSGGWMIARVAYVADNVALEQRGRIIAVMAGFNRAGALIGPSLAGVLVTQADYSSAFLVFAGFYVAALVFLLISARDTLSHRESQHVPIVAVVKRHKRVFITAGSVMVILQILRNARLWIIPVWGSTIGLSESSIGLVVSLSAAVDMLMFYPAGILLDRVGRRWALTPALALLGIFIAIMPITDDFTSYAICAILLGFGNGFGTGIFMTLGGDFSPRDGRGEFLGVWRLVGDIGTATGPLRHRRPRAMGFNHFRDGQYRPAGLCRDRRLMALRTRNLAAAPAHLGLSGYCCPSAAPSVNTTEFSCGNEPAGIAGSAAKSWRIASTLPAPQASQRRRRARPKMG